MYTSLYTVEVERGVVWLAARSGRWAIGRYVKKSRRVQYYSPKTATFLDAEDCKKIQAVAAEQMKAPKKQPAPKKQVGSVELLFWEGERGVASVRVGGHDQELEDKERGSVGDIEAWTEIATWTVTKGLKFNRQAHPAFKRDADAIASSAHEAIRGGSGVFNPKVLPEDNIFTNQAMDI